MLGHFPLLGTEPYKNAGKLSEKYGPIIGLRFGSFQSVLINDARLIKEATNNPAFSGRPKMPMFSDRSNGKHEGKLNNLITSLRSNSNNNF